MRVLVRSQNPHAEYQYNKSISLAAGDWLYMLSDLASGEESFTVADSLVLNYGTSADALADLTTLHDGNDYHITEVAGIPGQQLNLTFVDIVAFNRILVLGNYNGAANHSLTIQLFNLATLAWDLQDSMTTNIVYMHHFIAVPVDTNYIIPELLTLTFANITTDATIGDVITQAGTGASMTVYTSSTVNNTIQGLDLGTGTWNLVGAHATAGTLVTAPALAPPTVIATDERAVLFRFYHVLNGNAAHDTYIDYVALGEVSGSPVLPPSNIGGWIPDKSGFFEGYGLVMHHELTVGTAMAFRVYRNGVATPCVFLITSEFNDGLGITHARTFNIDPQSHTSQSDRDVYQFKAGERITIRAETPVHPDYTETTDIIKLNLFLYYTYDVQTPESLASAGVSGGLPGGGGDGDGGDIIVV
jgi:hypothetical protein